MKIGWLLGSIGTLAGLSHDLAVTILGRRVEGNDEGDLEGGQHRQGLVGSRMHDSTSKVECRHSLGIGKAPFIVKLSCLAFYTLTGRDCL